MKTFKNKSSLYFNLSLISLGIGLIGAIISFIYLLQPFEMPKAVSLVGSLLAMGGSILAGCFNKLGEKHENI